MAGEDTLPDGFEARLLRILTDSSHLGETIEAVFRRKEQALGSMFASLSGQVSRSLHARLDTPRNGDKLAAQFQRLVQDRRQRLLAFLGDGRRREAVAGGQ